VHRRHFFVAKIDSRRLRLLNLLYQVAQAFYGDGHWFVFERPRIVLQVHHGFARRVPDAYHRANNVTAGRNTKPVAKAGDVVELHVLAYFGRDFDLAGVFGVVVVAAHDFAREAGTGDRLYDPAARAVVNDLRKVVVKNHLLLAGGTGKSDGRLKQRAIQFVVDFDLRRNHLPGAVLGEVREQRFNRVAQGLGKVLVGHHGGKVALVFSLVALHGHLWQVAVDHVGVKSTLEVPLDGFLRQEFDLVLHGAKLQSQF